MGVDEEPVPDGGTAPIRAGSPPASEGGTRGRTERILKIAGAAAAVFSLGGALYGLGNFLYGAMHDRHAVADLIEIASAQQDREQFRDAWATLAEANEIAERRSFVIDADELHRAREDLGMAWLENSRIGNDETFTAMAAMVEPVLDRGLSSAASERRGDLLAHLGWAAFLRSREQSTTSGAVEGIYRKAIAADPANPYANAMLGHWIMWNAGDWDAASPYFVTALSSGRAVGFVRQLQLAALRNDPSAEAELERIRVANEIRKTDQALPEADRTDFLNIYYDFLRDDAGDYSIERILRVVPPEVHLLTFHWLFDRAGFEDGNELTRICYLGLLLEAAGRKEEALATFKELQPQLDGPGVVNDRVQSAIGRLSSARP